MSTWAIEDARPVRIRGCSVESLGLAEPAQRIHLLFEHLNAVEEVFNGLGHRIWKIGLVQVDARRHPLTVAVGHLARNSDDHGVRWHVPYHHRTGANATIVTHRDGAEHRGPGTHDHVVAQGRVSLPPPEAGTSQRPARGRSDVLPPLGRLADHDAHAVIDEEA